MSRRRAKRDTEPRARSLRNRDTSLLEGIDEGGVQGAALKALLLLDSALVKLAA